MLLRAAYHKRKSRCLTDEMRVRKNQFVRQHGQAPVGPVSADLRDKPHRNENLLAVGRLVAGDTQNNPARSWVARSWVAHAIVGLALLAETLGSHVQLHLAAAQIWAVKKHNLYSGSQPCHQASYF